MKGQMIFVKLSSNLVLRGQGVNQLINPISKVRRLEQEELNDKVADMSLVSFVVSQDHAKHQLVQGNNVVLPNQDVHGLKKRVSHCLFHPLDNSFPHLNVLSDVTSASRLAKVADENIAKGSDMYGQLLETHALQDLNSLAKDMQR